LAGFFGRDWFDDRDRLSKRGALNARLSQ
jgi:hypothetical protein